jgi:hypothetical protein
MATTRNKVPAEDACPWESGELGRSEVHVRVATPQEMAAVDDALGLQMISIRLQKRLLEALKDIAKFHGIGYQPMIRDLLNRFARSEIRTLMEMRLHGLEHEPGETPMKPVDDFMARIQDKKAA